MKKIHPASSRLVLRLLLSLCLLVALFFSSLPLTQEATASEPVAGPVISITINPNARKTIYRSVAVLPFLQEDNTVDLELTDTFFQALDTLQKYQLVPLRNSSTWYKKNKTKQKQLVHQAGQDLGAQAIISGSIHHPKTLLSEVTGIDHEKSAKYTFTMVDAKTGTTVWQLALSREKVLPTESFSITKDTMQQAITQLSTEMVRNGNIYSALLPMPEVLSYQGDIRSARIVLQPAPSYIFSAYQLLRANKEDGIFHPVTTPVPNEAPIILVDKNLDDGATYFYTILGLTENGFANVPAPPFPITTIGPPTPVSTLSALGGGLRQIQISWEPSQDPAVAGYVIFRSNEAGGPFQQIAEIKGRDKQTFIDKGQPSAFSRFGTLKDNTTYFYTIHTKNIVGVESADSAITSAVTKGVPPPPAEVRAITDQPLKVPITWQASLDPVIKGYAIFRSKKEEGPFLQIDYVSDQKQQEYIDSGSWDTPLENNTTYYYFVRSVNVVDVHSPDSPIVSATTKAAPTLVTAFSAENGLLKSVRLSWQISPEPDIAEYEIFRGTAEEGVRRKITSVQAAQTEYVDSGLDDGRMYWYQIRSIDTDGLLSPLTKSIKAVTKRPPLRPLGLRAQAGATGIQVSWNPNHEKDIDHYDIATVGFLTGTPEQTTEPFFLYQQEEKPGTTIRFKVRAVDSDGLKSEYSEPIVITWPE